MSVTSTKVYTWVQPCAELAVQEDKKKNNKVRDLGVIVDSKLSFTDHITVKVNKAYCILVIIKRNFQHVDKDAFVLLY